jgi:rare lipoprotein A
MKYSALLFFVCLIFIAPSTSKAQNTLGDSLKGRATFYSPKLDGKKTYFGEVFSSKELTAAHRSLPHNTMVEVTNLANQKSVIVRINDRGPFAHNKSRLIDVSKAAAGKLGLISQGVADVVVRVIGAEGKVLLQPRDKSLQAISEMITNMFKIAVTPGNRPTPE